MKRAVLAALAPPLQGKVAPPSPAATERVSTAFAMRAMDSRVVARENAHRDGDRDPPPPAPSEPGTPSLREENKEAESPPFLFPLSSFLPLRARR